MIVVTASFLGGIAAHQTKRFCDGFKGDWGYFSKLVIGVLTIGLFFVAMLEHLNPKAVRDGILAYAGAAAAVGTGVITAHVIDHVHLKV